MRACLVFSLALLAASAADAARWTAHPDKSRLSFTAIQEGAEFSGVFNDFSAGFEFDPADPDGGSINATIRLASVDTQYRERDEYLAQKEWFHVDLWPEAIYTVESFRRLSESEYVADGLLTLRDVSKNVRLKFTLLVDELGENAVMTGSASFNRLDFGVGQGDWKDTSWVGDPIKVKIELQLLRSFE
jgi:polyisoprenoid-binding protein YceI